MRIVYRLAVKHNTVRCAASATDGAASALKGNFDDAKSNEDSPSAPLHEDASQSSNSSETATDIRMLPRAERSVVGGDIDRRQSAGIPLTDENMVVGMSGGSSTRTRAKRDLLHIPSWFGVRSDAEYPGDDYDDGNSVEGWSRDADAELM
jgi:hypothetical protein